MWIPVLIYQLTVYYKPEEDECDSFITSELKEGVKCKSTLTHQRIWNAANMVVVFLLSVFIISALLTNSSDKFNLNTSKYFQFKGFFTGNITQTSRFGETMNLNTSFALSYLSFARSRPIVVSVGPDPLLSLIHFGETMKLNYSCAFSRSSFFHYWPFSPDGSLRKTQKSSLMEVLTKDFSPLDTIPPHSALVIDGMSIVQKVVHAPDTFGQLGEKLLSNILAEGRAHGRIDVVFDVYREMSIKNSERSRRTNSKKTTSFQSLTPSHKIKDWRGFLTSGSNKTALVKFLVELWSEDHNKKKIQTEFYVTVGCKCLKISSQSVAEVQELATEQEEADTRVFLHALHAAKSHIGTVVVKADDTDIAVIGLRLVPQFSLYGANIYIKVGTQNRIKHFNLTEMHAKLGTPICNALLGFHALTGWDSVSSFCGKGKKKAFATLKKSSNHAEFLSSLGKDFSVTDEQVKMIEKFVCCLYGSPNSTDINDLRYAIFVGKKTTTESQNLPPCFNSLKLHIQRANYQAAIWVRSLEQNPNIPSPVGHGWSCEEGDLIVNWMDCQPAPDSVLELLACTCSRECKDSSCSCMINGLNCTDMCKLKNCCNARRDDLNFESGKPSTAVDTDVKSDSDDSLSACSFDSEDDDHIVYSLVD